jgi:hypothetical protein
MAQENEPGCLESIFGRVRIASLPARGGKDHRPVPPHKKLKCSFIPMAHPPFQQYSIRDGTIAGHVSNPSHILDQGSLRL